GAHGGVVPMVVMITGAAGFLGRHAAKALEAAGHRVVRARRPEVDYTRDVDERAWLPRLQGIDVVVNAVGVFAGASEATMDSVHARAPIALFDACAAEGVRVVQ